MPQDRVATDDLRGATAAMRSAHWIVRVLDPRRPRPRQITDWADALRFSRKEPDARLSAELARPKSLLAQRLAGHIATLATVEGDAHHLAWQASVVEGAPLIPWVLWLASSAGVLPRTGCAVGDAATAAGTVGVLELPPIIMMHAASKALRDQSSGEVDAYLKVRRILAQADMDPDLAETEGAIRRERREVRRAARADEEAMASKVPTGTGASSADGSTATIDHRA